MATTNNTIELQAALDKAKSVKNINKDIDKIKGQIKPLELQVKAEAISGSISSPISAELKKAESVTANSLNNILSIWSGFGEAAEKTLKSRNIAAGFNSLLSFVSALNDTTKGTLGSLGTTGLGAGLFGITKSVDYFVKNFA